MSTDFASAAMLRVLAEGMRRLGLVPPPAVLGTAERTGRAHVPLDQKRHLVAAAVGQGGLGCLPLLARGLQRDRQEPVHQALTSAGDAGALFARWQRLERYIHATHRIQVLALEAGAGRGTGQACLLHASLRGPAPQPAEDLVVLGVLAALLEEIGLRDVTATVDGAPAWPAPDAAALAQRAAAARTARLQLRWRVAREPADGGPAGDHTGSRSAPAGRTNAESADAPPWLAGLAVHGALLAQTAGQTVVDAATRRLALHLSAPPSVAQLAVQLGLAPRTLQRALHAAGTGHADLLARLRCRAAAWWLLQHDLPVAEVGYLCGYADQAHFSRAFRSRVGVPPGSFRQAFQAGRAALP